MPRSLTTALPTTSHTRATYCRPSNSPADHHNALTVTSSAISHGPVMLQRPVGAVLAHILHTTASALMPWGARHPPPANMSYQNAQPAEAPILHHMLTAPCRQPCSTSRDTRLQTLVHSTCTLISGIHQSEGLALCLHASGCQGPVPCTGFGFRLGSSFHLCLFSSFFFSSLFLPSVQPSHNWQRLFSHYDTPAPTLHAPCP